MKKSNFPDPFEKARSEKGIGDIDDQGEPVKMVLRFDDVQKCAENAKTFQSGGTVGRIVVPSEEKIRDIRQIPFEVDPPLHGEYRALIEDWFKRPFQPDYNEKLHVLTKAILDEMLSLDSFEVVSEFSLPLQSRALTLLLNIEPEEADVWIAWGTHVFRSEDNPLDSAKANILYDYIDGQIDKAAANPGEDLYSVLLKVDFQGRKLTKEEIKGIMILTFAGGRDTVINALTNMISYFAEHPETLELIREKPRTVHKLTEELIRYFSPLTHMGRVVTEDTQVCKHAMQSDSRISLCWASANRDPDVFEKPNEIVPDRRKNPHVGFGFSHHQCLGAHHTRQLMKSLMKAMGEKIHSIEINAFEENIEEWGEFNRKVGFEKLHVSFS